MQLYFCINNRIVLLLLAVLLYSRSSAYSDAHVVFTPHLVVVDGPYSFNGSHADGESDSDKRATTYAANLTPNQLKGVYNIDASSTAGKGKTIAIIGAYAHPSAEADLEVFSSQYGLPSCTTANGCFKRVDQNGGTNFPTGTNAGWGQEAALDIQWVHAIAPGANILFVEANGPGTIDLFTAITFASKHADYVSMSFGTPEFAGQLSYENVFASAPTVSFFAACGDNGAAAEYPAVSQFVVAVGGTSLITTSTGAFSQEAGWSGSGGGCSTKISATAAQLSTTQKHCGNKRAVPDVSFNADPKSGVRVYTVEGCTAAPNCWYTVGGTSLSAPIMAARSAIRGDLVTSAYVYGGSRITYRDVTTGSNGYAAAAGYDLNTGLGSWIGDKATVVTSTQAPVLQATTKPTTKVTATTATTKASATSKATTTTRSPTNAPTTTTTIPTTKSKATTAPTSKKGNHKKPR